MKRFGRRYNSDGPRLFFDGHPISAYKQKPTGPFGQVCLLIAEFRNDPIRGLAIIIGTVALYVLSVGPACWISQRTGWGVVTGTIEIVHWPLLYFALEDDPKAHPEKPLRSLLRAWMTVGVEDGMRPARYNWHLVWQFDPYRGSL